jgi:hypothetical protein
VERLAADRSGEALYLSQQMDVFMGVAACVFADDQQHKLDNQLQPSGREWMGRRKGPVAARLLVSAFCLPGLPVILFMLLHESAISIVCFFDAGLSTGLTRTFLWREW